MSLVLPWQGLQLEQHPEVYRPAEDTDLMLRALDALPVAGGARACDVGTGTGALALALARRGARVLAVDRHPAAVRLARANAARNGLALGVARSDLLEGVRGPFDLIVFNPPYLPVEGEARGPLAQAWEGGEGGIAWAPTFLEGLAHTLAPRGGALVCLSSLGDPEGFRRLAARQGFACATAASEKLSWEMLEAVRLHRVHPGNL